MEDCCKRFGIPEYGVVVPIMKYLTKRPHWGFNRFPDIVVQRWIVIPKEEYVRLYQTASC